MASANTLYTYGVRTAEARVARKRYDSAYVERRQAEGAQTTTGLEIVQVLRLLPDMHIAINLVAERTGFTDAHLRRLRSGRYGEIPHMWVPKVREFLNGSEGLFLEYEQALDDLASSVEFAKMQRGEGHGHQYVLAKHALAAADYARALVPFNQQVGHAFPRQVRKVWTESPRKEMIFASRYDGILGALELAATQRRRALNKAWKLVDAARDRMMPVVAAA